MTRCDSSNSLPTFVSFVPFVVIIPPPRSNPRSWVAPKDHLRVRDSDRYGVASFRDLPPGVRYEIHHPMRAEGDYLRIVLIQGEVRVMPLPVPRE